MSVCVAPPTHADRFRGGVDPQLSTEGRGGGDGACAPEAGARVLSPSVGELLPLCHYDYMMLLIPRSK